MLLNTGSTRPPRLRSDLNLGVYWDLPTWSKGYETDPDRRHHNVAAAGYEGVQADTITLAKAHGLGCTFPGRFDSPQEVDAKTALWVSQGYEAASVHVGSGLEDDATIDAYALAILAAVRRHRFPLFVETHRATITQDMWRTVQLVTRHPDLRINADFSHWYTGQEMLYGDMEAKLAFLAPVFARVGFMHGRIGTSGCMQVRLDDPQVLPAIATFREMWVRSMLGFLGLAGPGDVLPFNPELLPSCINYARDVRGPDDEPREECDRWEESLRLTALAKECWEEALRRHAADRK